jgi:hypothetical protein
VTEHADDLRTTAAELQGVLAVVMGTWESRHDACDLVMMHVICCTAAAFALLAFPAAAVGARIRQQNQKQFCLVFNFEQSSSLRVTRDPVHLDWNIAS